jgi:hypothetical protein
MRRLLLLTCCAVILSHLPNAQTLSTSAQSSDEHGFLVISAFDCFGGVIPQVGIEALETSGKRFSGILKTAEGIDLPYGVYQVQIG